MTRHEEIINAANECVTKTHSPSTNEFQTAMNIAVTKAYIAAAEWSDKTMIEKACKWLQKEILEDYKGIVWDQIVEDFRKAMEE